MTRNGIVTADDLWEAACCHFPTVPPEEQRAGLMLLQELARGEPVAVAHLARPLGRAVETAEAFVTATALSPFVYKDEEGRIQGFYGLSVTPTHHQVTINGRKLWAWCAPDTLAHPELLRATAAIETRDPETGELVRLTVSPDRIESVEPTAAVSSIRRPEAWDATSAARIMATACHFNFFFASLEAGESWVAKHPETILQSLGAVTY
jgi:alkylmercury lyase